MSVEESETSEYQVPGPNSSPPIPEGGLSPHPVWGDIAPIESAAAAVNILEEYMVPATDIAKGKLAPRSKSSIRMDLKEGRKGLTDSPDDEEDEEDEEDDTKAISDPIGKNVKNKIVFNKEKRQELIQQRKEMIQQKVDADNKGKGLFIQGKQEFVLADIEIEPEELLKRDTETEEIQEDPFEWVSSMLFAHYKNKEERKPGNELSKERKEEIKNLGKKENKDKVLELIKEFYLAVQDDESERESLREKLNEDIEGLNLNPNDFFMKYTYIDINDKSIDTEIFSEDEERELPKDIDTEVNEAVNINDEYVILLDHLGERKELYIKCLSKEKNSEDIEIGKFAIINEEDEEEGTEGIDSGTIDLVLNEYGIELDTLNYLILDIIKVEGEDTLLTEEQQLLQAKDRFIHDIIERTEGNMIYQENEQIDDFINETIIKQKAFNSHYKKVKIANMALTYIQMIKDNLKDKESYYPKEAPNYHPLIENLFNNNPCYWMVPLSDFETMTLESLEEQYSALDKIEEIEKDKQISYKVALKKINEINTHRLSLVRNYHLDTLYKTIKVEDKENQMYDTYSCISKNEDGEPELYNFKGADFTIEYKNISKTDRQRIEQYKTVQLTDGEDINMTGLSLFPKTWNFKIPLDEKYVSLQTKIILFKQNFYNELVSDILKDAEPVEMSCDNIELDSSAPISEEGEDSEDSEEEAVEEEAVEVEAVEAAEEEATNLSSQLGDMADFELDDSPAAEVEEPEGTVGNNRAKIINFNRDCSEEQIKLVLSKMFPDIENIIDLSKIFSISDLNKALLLYNISFNDLSSKESTIILNSIDENIDQITSELMDIEEPDRNKKKRPKLDELSFRKNILSYIFEIEHEERRLSLLNRFLKMFCRKPNTQGESVYNIYYKKLNEFAICRHWEHLIHFDKDILSEQYSIDKPVDGKYICKHCFEVLYDEEGNADTGFAAGEDGGRTVQAEIMTEEDEIELIGEFRDIKLIEDLIGIKLKKPEREIIKILMESGISFYDLSTKRLTSSIKNNFIKNHPDISNVASEIKKLKKQLKQAKKSGGGNRVLEPIEEGIETKKQELESIKASIVNKIDIATKILTRLILVFIIIDTSIPDYEINILTIFSDLSIPVDFNIDKKEGLDMFLFILNKLKDKYYSDKEYKILIEEEFDNIEEQISTIYDNIKQISTLSLRISKKRDYNSNAKVKHLEILSWASYRPNPHNNIIKQINDQIISSIQEDLLFRKLTEIMFVNWTFIDDITVEQFDIEPTVYPQIFQCCSREDTIKLYEYYLFEILIDASNISKMKKAYSGSGKNLDQLLLRCSLEYPDFEFTEDPEDPEKDPVANTENPYELYATFIEKGIVNKLISEEEDIKSWNFDLRLKYYVRNTLNPVRELFLQVDESNLLEAIREELPAKIDEMKEKLNEYLDVSMLETLYKGYNEKQCESFSLHKSTENSPELLSQRKYIEGLCDIRGLLCIMTEEPDKGIPEEWKLIGRSKQIFTEWKKGISHSKPGIAIDKSPYIFGVDFKEPTGISSDLLRYTAPCFSLLDLITYGETDEYNDSIIVLSEYLLINCFYTLVEFYECLDPEKDCSSNPLFSALDSDRVENQQKLRDIPMAILEQLHSKDQKYREEMENMEVIMAKHIEAEKSEYIAAIEAKGMEEQFLAQMLKEAGYNVIVKDLKEKYEMGGDGPEQDPLDTYTGEESMTPNPNTVQPEVEEDYDNGETADGDLED